MGFMDRMRENARELDRQDQQKRSAQEAQARLFYRPEADVPGLGRFKLVSGLFLLASLAGFIGLSLMNTPGFWMKYVLLPYLLLAAVLLFFTNGWIRLLFQKEGDLPVKEYQKSIGQIKGSAKCLPFVWGITALAEAWYLLFGHPQQPLAEALFFAGCAAFALCAWLFRRYADRMDYFLWDPDEPVL